MHMIDNDHDTHGYIGYTESQKAIYVTFRGSESIQNWISNLDAILTSYPLCNGCEVHKGFYTAEQAVFPAVLSQVNALTAKYPSYSVIVTGHSLGAALATLTAMDLLANKVKNVRLFNYGSPRVGNTDFATYTSTVLVDRNRVTHHKDMVPHAPMHERFTHISGEFYEPDDTITLNTCSGFEDPNCSYQWHITSIDDHLWYLGVTLGTGGCAAIL
jgi:predicted lipase